MRDQDTFPARLESNVLSLGYQVSNLAVSGYSIDQYYLMLNRNIRKFKDLKYVILVIYTGNDYDESMTDVTHGRRKPLYILKDGVLHLSNVPISRYDTRNIIAYSRLLLAATEKQPNLTMWPRGERAAI